MALVAMGAALVLSQRRVLGMHKEFGRRILTAQDAERAWVAREVHDDMVQRLAVLRHEVARYREEFAPPPGQDRRLEGLEGEIADLNEALRRLAHRLHPSTLDHGDLQLAMDQLAEEALRLYGLEVELAVDVPDSFRHPGVTLTVYRIGQEALRNVWRHAGSTRVRMTLALNGAMLHFTVRDHGRGFDAAARARAPRQLRDGLGLVTIRERAQQAGGAATITASPGAGTLVAVQLPTGGEAR